MESDGCVLRSAGARGDGVFATRSFRAGETVLVGIIERWFNENHSHATQIDASTYVQLSGLAPKVNHSCDPNCGVRVNDRGAPDLVARRLIAAGEEITFDYAMRNYSIEHFPAECGCGSPLCRRFVTGWKDLSEEQRTSYTGMVAPYLLEMDNSEEAGVCHSSTT